MKRLPAPEHLDELLEPARARLGLLGVLEAIEDRVAVLAVERRERLRAPRGRRRAPPAGRAGPRCCAATRYAASQRPSAFARSTSASPAGRILPSRDQRRDLADVDLRPLRARPPRRVLLQEVASRRAPCAGRRSSRSTAQHRALRAPSTLLPPCPSWRPASRCRRCRRGWPPSTPRTRPCDANCAARPSDGAIVHSNCDVQAPDHGLGGRAGALARAPRGVRPDRRRRRPAARPTNASEAVKEIYSDYRADGKIDVCNHERADLQDALDTIEPEFDTDNPDFRAALEAGIQRHDDGRCCEDEGDATPTATATATATATPTADRRRRRCSRRRTTARRRRRRRRDPAARRRHAPARGRHAAARSRRDADAAPAAARRHAVAARHRPPSRPPPSADAGGRRELLRRQPAAARDPARARPAVRRWRSLAFPLLARRNPRVDAAWQEVRFRTRDDVDGLHRLAAPRALS